MPSTIRRRARLACALILGLAPALALGHFQELIPSTDILTESTGKPLKLDLLFTHPMQRGPAMDMGPPIRFGVLGAQGREELTNHLKPVQVDGKRAYTADYRVRQPGDHVFFLEPAPYWEPAEGVMIIHYTKVVVSAFGGEEGWETAVGLPVEIEPLTRPYGLWAGNLFQGVVKQDGKPVPFATVEVEWRNDGSLATPPDPYVTQVVRADANGVFAYAMPRAGWWGFAALLDGATPMRNPEGREVPVELGGLLWVRTRDMR